jgi:hypothetical protein
MQMKHLYTYVVFFVFLSNLTINTFAAERPLSREDPHDKINVFWLGQLVGNYIGLSFENNYVDEAVPELIDRIYSIEDDIKLEINDDWRETRKKIHKKYFRYKKGSYEAPVSVVSSLNNGLCGIMAILYGEGDFMKSVSIATSAGYDCDNQAATVGGLMGVINGTKCIPEEFTKGIADFGEPFNDLYINYTRDELPIATPISEIVNRIVNISEKAILDNGGRVEVVSNSASSVVNKEITITYSGVDYTLKFGFNDATISGGNFDEETFVEYVQDGDRVRLEIWDNDNSIMKLEGFYDGKNIESVKEIYVDVFEEDIYGEITYIIKSDF